MKLTARITKTTLLLVLLPTVVWAELKGDYWAIFYWYFLIIALPFLGSFLFIKLSLFYSFCKSKRPIYLLAFVLCLSLTISFQVEMEDDWITSTLKWYYLVVLASMGLIIRRRIR